MSRTEQDHVDMIEHPERWPVKHNLPVKHSTEKDATGWPKLAVVRKNPATTGFLLLYTNLHNITPESQLSACEIEAFVDGDSLVKAGWRVD